MTSSYDYNSNSTPSASFDPGPWQFISTDPFTSHPMKY
jgi:hypothetical protein